MWDWTNYIDIVLGVYGWWQDLGETCAMAIDWLGRGPQRPFGGWR